MLRDAIVQREGSQVRIPGSALRKNVSSELHYIPLWLLQTYVYTHTGHERLQPEKSVLITAIAMRSG